MKPVVMLKNNVKAFTGNIMLGTVSVSEQNIAETICTKFHAFITIAVFSYFFYTYLLDYMAKGDWKKKVYSKENSK